MPFVFRTNLNSPDYFNSPFYTSPDIWIAGQEQLPDPTKICTDDWNKTGSSAVKKDLNNYIYVRGKFEPDGPETPPGEVTLSLFLLPTNLFSRADQWDTPENRVSTVIWPDNSPVIVNPGMNARCIGFEWTDPAHGLGHYCFVAYAQHDSKTMSEQLDEDVPGWQTSPINLSALVQKDHRFGWKNLQVRELAAGKWNESIRFDVPDTFQTDYIDVTITMECPPDFEGAVVNLHSTDKSSFNKQFEISDYRVSSGENLIKTSCRVEPGFSTEIKMDIDGTGMNAKPAAGSMISLSSSIKPKDDHEMQQVTERGLVNNAVADRVTRALCLSGERDLTPYPSLLISEMHYEFR